MSDYEAAANAFRRIVDDFGHDPDPSFSESDTRAKIIDTILRDVLGWSETDNRIRREEHVHHGYLDYYLRSATRGLVLEAKKSGLLFTLPTGLTFGQRVSVKNLLKMQDELANMYDQVVGYAHERGVQFCALSNGTQWLIFPGVRTDQIRVRQSRVVVFNGFADIERNFVEFWDLLSMEGVDLGNLERSLLPPLHGIEPTYVFNAEGRSNIPFDRNPLSLVLEDLLPKYFGDLHGDPDATEMLRQCFVSDTPIGQTMEEIGHKVSDERPSKSLSVAGPMIHLYSLPQVAQKLNAQLASFLRGERSKYLQVMVGRVGIGKTTFLSHFFSVQRQELMNDHFVLIIDFRNVTEETDLNHHFTDAVWDSLTNHPRFSALTSARTLREIFADDIRPLELGVYAKLKVSNPERYEEEISLFLGRQFQDRPRFLSKMSKYLSQSGFARFILAFDNVDQLDLPLQERVIQLAHSKMTQFNAFVILSMWEETYFTSKRTGRTLSTIRTVPMEIARQSPSAVIVKRLEYLISQVKEEQELLPLLDDEVCDRNTFCDFLELILRSLLVRNRRVRTFLEVVALGNIRSALEMFHAFLTAGSLDTSKILGCMKENDEYLVPIHEFIKSIMLGSKRFYSERTSMVLNLFAIGDVEHPSHFTRLRLLQWLFNRRHETTTFGTGFISLARIQEYSRGVGISDLDCTTSLKRLVEGALVENDLRAQKLVEDTQAVRITPTGRYYLTTLHRLFAYIDLVMQDTPFIDREAFDVVEKKCDSSDMRDRFERCDRFLTYLEEQEAEELITLSKVAHEDEPQRRFMITVRRSFEREKQYIVDRGLSWFGEKN